MGDHQETPSAVGNGATVAQGFSSMWLSTNGKVASNLRLAGGSLRALRLPPPPKTGTTLSPLLLLLDSSPIQTDSQHACQTQRNRSDADHAYSAVWDYQNNW